MYKLLKVAFILISLSMTLRSQSNDLSLNEFEDIYQFNIDSLFNSTSTLSDCKLLLLGECHGLPSGNELRIQVAKEFFTEDHNVFIVESSRSYGYLLDRYLNTGDIKYLNFDNDEKFRESTRYSELKEIMDGLRSFSSVSGGDNKIEIIGVDIERHGLEPIIFSLNETLIENKSNSNEELIFIINELRKANKLNQKKRKAFSNNFFKEDIVNSLIQNQDTSKSNILVRDILLGLKEFMSQKKWMLVRDDYMFKNLEDIVYSKGIGKVYFQVGLFHLMNDEYHETLAMKLKQNGMDKTLYSIGRIEYVDVESSGCTIYDNLSKGERNLLLSNWYEQLNLEFSSNLGLLSGEQDYYDFRILTKECR